MPSVRRNSSPQRTSDPSANETGETKPTQPEEAESRELTCEQTPPLSGGLLLPLALSKLERLPPILLAHGVGDLLEFDERSNLGAASKTTHAAMCLGSTHPLYARLYALQAAYRMNGATKDAVKLAQDKVKADRARREKAECARAAFAVARKSWAATVQRTFAADPHGVLSVSPAATLLGELGRTDTAVQVLRWFLPQCPKDGFARLQLAETLLQARPSVQSGVLTDPAEEAIAEARVLKERDPRDPRPRVLIARGLLLQARELIRRGDHARGLAAQASALAELREDPAVDDLLTLAMVEHSLGHETESASAIKTYLDTRRGRPNDARLAEVYAWRREPALALDCLERILERNIHDHGLCHVAQSRFMDGIHGDKRWLPLLSRMNRAPDQLAAIPLEIELPA